MQVEHAELEGICTGLKMITKDLTSYENGIPLTDFVYLENGAKRILDILNEIKYENKIEGIECSK